MSKFKTSDRNDQIALFRGTAEFGRYRGTADIDLSSPRRAADRLIVASRRQAIAANHQPFG
jgi:hypothetical protein